MMSSLEELESNPPDDLYLLTKRLVDCLCPKFDTQNESKAMKLALEKIKQIGEIPALCLDDPADRCAFVYHFFLSQVNMVRGAFGAYCGERSTPGLFKSARRGKLEVVSIGAGFGGDLLGLLLWLAENDFFECEINGSRLDCGVEGKFEVEQRVLCTAIARAGWQLKLRNFGTDVTDVPEIGFGESAAAADVINVVHAFPGTGLSRIVDALLDVLPYAKCGCVLAVVDFHDGKRFEAVERLVRLLGFEHVDDDRKQKTFEPGSAYFPIDERNSVDESFGGLIRAWGAPPWIGKTCFAAMFQRKAEISSEGNRDSIRCEVLGISRGGTFRNRAAKAAAFLERVGFPKRHSDEEKEKSDCIEDDRSLLKSDKAAESRAPSPCVSVVRNEPATKRQGSRDDQSSPEPGEIEPDYECSSDWKPARSGSESNLVPNENNDACRNAEEIEITHQESNDGVEGENDQGVPWTEIAVGKQMMPQYKVGKVCVVASGFAQAQRTRMSGLDVEANGAATPKEAKDRGYATLEHPKSARNTVPVPCTNPNPCNDIPQVHNTFPNSGWGGERKRGGRLEWVNHPDQLFGDMYCPPPSQGWGAPSHASFRGGRGHIGSNARPDCNYGWGRLDASHVLKRPRIEHPPNHNAPVTIGSCSVLQGQQRLAGMGIPLLPPSRSQSHSTESTGCLVRDDDAPFGPPHGAMLETNSPYVPRRPDGFRMKNGGGVWGNDRFVNGGAGCNPGGFGGIGNSHQNAGRHSYFGRHYNDGRGLRGRGKPLGRGRVGRGRRGRGML